MRVKRFTVDIDELKRKWDYLGASDPLWAVMTDDSKKGNQWNREEFFETGRTDARAFVALARHLVPALKIEWALDFGCGVGRLTQGHAPFVHRMTGVDISGPMIEQANALNAFPDKVDFQLNTNPDLTHFERGTFTYIISHIVLQHVPASIHRLYIQEFARVLRPGGVCIFQLPEPFADGWGSASFTDDNRDKIDMYGSPQAEVIATIEQAGGRLLQVEVDGACGPGHTSYRYVFTKG